MWSSLAQVNLSGLAKMSVRVRGKKGFVDAGVSLRHVAAGNATYDQAVESCEMPFQILVSEI
jgi:hypothetical protein